MENMQLNDNKAGMKGLDKDRINAIIKQATEGSNFHKKQMKRENELNSRVKIMQEQVTQLSQRDIDIAQKQMDHMVILLELSRRIDQVIVHVDMDAFYAQVEMRNNPQLRHIPMAVGGMSMLSTSNYAARRFGVRAAMPGFIALKLCPNLKIVKGNQAKYGKISEQIREVLVNFDPNLKNMSMDEAYLNITNYVANIRTTSQVVERVRYCGDCKCWLPYESNPGDLGDFEDIGECGKCGKKRRIVRDTIEFGNCPQQVVQLIRHKIHQTTGLTASAGIACNCMLAKVCSDINKPNGQYYLPPNVQQIKHFVHTLPVRKISGIGSVSDSLLRGLAIVTCGDLYANRGKIKLLFSQISADDFMQIALGLGSTSICSERQRKSISVENTFNREENPDKLQEICRKLCVELSEDMASQNIKGRTVTLKLKTVDFEVRTRAKSVSFDVTNNEQLFAVANAILTKEIQAEGVKGLPLRLLGVRLSNFVDSIENTRGIATFLVPHSTSTTDVSFDSDDDDSTITVNSSLWFVCPVCNIKVGVVEENEMSIHVEDCLSLHKVNDILKQENEAPAKSLNKTPESRKRTAPNCSSKSTTPKMNRIDSYFHKK